MTLGPWKMPRNVHRLMVERAEADYPEETCGFLFGTDNALEVVPMENVQNKLHVDSPDQFPRDARTAYYFDPLEMQKVLEAKEKTGIPFRAIYHSHPDHDAYFSPTDSEVATVFGEPNYLGVVYLVYSVHAGKSGDVKAFDWSNAKSRYVEIPVEIGDG